MDAVSVGEPAQIFEALVERRAGGRARPAADRVVSSRELQREDATHLLHPFTDHRALRRSGPRVFVRGEGIHLIDAEGLRWVDAMSGLWCVTLGYGRDEIVEAAQAQMRTLPYCSSFFGDTHPAAIELARTIAGLTPAGLDQVFFCNSGSEANDTAVRMARRYWELRGQPGRRVVISRRNAYHGSTLAGVSLGGFPSMHAQGGPPLPDVVHIRQPYRYGEGRELSPEAFGLAAARALEDAIVAVGAERVAAFIAEPVQAAGGVVIPPETYWPAVEAIARRHGVLVIADEVVCGFGRTGAWFGCQTMRFTPHLMTLSKGLSSGYAPIAATVVANDIAGELRAFDGEFEHGFTCSGHPVSCAVALKTIEILRREHVVATVRQETGPHLASLLAALRGRALVAEIRSIGLMAALEIAHPDPSAQAMPEPGALGAAVRAACATRRLIVRAEGDTIMLAPPLVCTRAELQRIVATLDDALAVVGAALTDGAPSGARIVPS